MSDRDPWGLTEAQFQAQLIGLARFAGWTVNHVRPSEGRRGGQRAWQTTTSVTGWPDLTIWRPGRFLVAELKSDRGRLTAAQQTVLDSLTAAGVECHIWRPRDFDAIEQLLTAPTRRPGGTRP
jgi:hypothetical protein